MGYFVGRQGVLGIARESSRGVAVTPAYYLPYNSISLDDKAVVVDSEGAFGNIADTYESYVVKKFAEGEIEFDLDDKAIGVILAGVAGAAPSSAGSTNYTHTYTISNTNQHASLSVYVQDLNLSRMYRLSMINKFTIKIDREGLVKCTVAFKGAQGQDWTRLTPVYTALGNKFIHTHLVFKIAADVSSIAAASPINLNSLEFNAMKAIEDFQDMGSVTPSDILNKQLAIEGSIELGFNDATYKNYMLLGTTRAMDITLTYGANNSLQIQMPKVRFANWEPNKGLNDIASEKIEFKAQYDLANTLTQISTLVLKNQVVSY